MGAAVKEDPRAATIRRRDFAIDWLQVMTDQKIGRNTYGDLNVRVRFQGGEIPAVKVIDETDYK